MDHVGGTETFREDGTEVIAHQTFPRTQRYLKALAPFFLRRNRVFYPESIPPIPDLIAPLALSYLYPTFDIDRLTTDQSDFDVGGTTLVLTAPTGADGADSHQRRYPDTLTLSSAHF